MSECCLNLLRFKIFRFCYSACNIRKFDYRIGHLLFPDNEFIRNAQAIFPDLFEYLSMPVNSNQRDKFTAEGDKASYKQIKYLVLRCEIKIFKHLCHLDPFGLKLVDFLFLKCRSKCFDSFGSTIEFCKHCPLTQSK